MAVLCLLALFPALSLSMSCGGEPAGRSGGPLRIVSLVPAATETLFALGVGDLVVARSAWCDEPPEARGIPPAGDALTVSAETVLLFQPDLVLVGGQTQERALGPLADRAEIRSVLPETIADVRRVIRELAERVGRVPEGEALVARIDTVLGIAREARPCAGRRVIFVVQREPLRVAGAGSCVGELIAALGAENVAGDMAAAWPEMSAESLVARDPEVVLDASPGEDEGFWQRYSTLAATRRGAVVRVTDSSLVRPGPRLPELLALLERSIRGVGR